MHRVLLHIGMPRTASTFFQQEVFPKVNDFKFWGINKSQYTWPFQKVLYQDDSLYNEYEIQQALNFPITNPLIISNELFVGQSLFMVSTNRSRTSHRLKQLFPNAEIILVLRNQAQILESLFSIGVYSGQSKKPEAFVRFSDNHSDSTDPLYPTFSATEQTEQYLFSHLFNLYRSKFEKIHVFLYEDFKENPKEFIADLCNRLDISMEGEVNFGKRSNSSFSTRQLEYLRRTNSLKEIFERSGAGKRLFRKNIQAAEHLFGGNKKFHFAPALRKRIEKHFMSDNELLPELIPELKNSETFRKYYLSDN